jgi:hypothetical protein
MLAGAVVLVAGLTLAAIPHHPSSSQRATDLRGVVQEMNTDIESCAGGVSESLTALRAIQGGTSHDVKTAVSIATFGAANCSPANSMPMDDLVGYQVHESLSSFRLDRVTSGLLTWAFPYAQRVQNDVAAILRAQGAARATATTKLNSDLKVLDAQRAYLDKIMMAAISATGASGRPPPLPG